MKIISCSLALLAVLFLCSFSSSLKEEENILKLTLELERINELLRESTENKEEGVVIVTNNEISADLQLNKFNQAVKLVQSRKELAVERPHLAVESFKIKDDKAMLKFNYTDYTIKMRFRLEEGKWMVHSYRLSGNGKFVYENDF